MSCALSWGSILRITLLLLLLASITTACFTLPVQKDLGEWGPLVLAVAYVPLTILAVPASVLTLGGGYLFGLPIGIMADSIGAVVGAASAFLLGRTIMKPYVISKSKDYPQFQAVAIATQRSGFKIVLLLRLVPLLPFNILNYILSVTPVPLGSYMLASWLGMMPMTIILVYVGTTLKDISDVTHGWDDFSPRRWVFLISSLVVSVVLMICVTKVAKSALDKVLANNEKETHGHSTPPKLPLSADEPSADLQQPLIVKVDLDHDNQRK